MRTQDFSAPALIRSIEANAVDGIKAWARWPKLTLREKPEIAWTLSPIPSPLFNAVLRTRMAQKNADDLIEEALDGFHSLPMTWWVGPRDQPADLGDRLEARGLTCAGVAAGMAADLSSLPENPPATKGLSIEEVRDATALRGCFRVIAPVCGFPDFAARAWLDIHNALGLDGPWRHFLAKVDGKPAAASSLFLGSRAAGIANVAALPDVRRRGIGTAISLSPLRLARRMGYRVATLFSSPMAEGMYRKMGFRKYCEGRGYIRLDGPSRPARRRRPES